MPNDIIGAPEPVIIKDRIFYFAPLTAYELSRLEAWVQWRTNREVELLSESGLAEISTVAGAIQLLYYSTLRSQPANLIELGELVFEDEKACSDIYENWYRINFVEVAEVKFEGESTSKGPVDPNSIYFQLTEVYGWSPQTISQLTPHQQLVYLKRSLSSMPDRKTATFVDTEAYINWLNSPNGPKQRQY